MAVARDDRASSLRHPRRLVELARQQMCIRDSIQGTAADVIRRAMIRMPTAIADIPAKMLLQVHDELLFEVEEDAAPALILSLIHI